MIWKMRIGNRGAALVEFSLVAMMLILLVFGITEFSLLMKDYLSLSQAAREGARSAALGQDAATITSVTQSSATALSPDQEQQIAVNISYRVYDGTSWPSAWTPGTPPTTLTNSEVQVQVQAAYAHPLIIGPLFGLGSTRTLTASMVMRKE